MKRTIILLLICLLLCGCAAKAPEPAVTPEPSAVPTRASTAAPTASPAPAATAAPSVLVLQPFSDADSAAMSRFMSRGRWLIDGERMYGMDYDEQLRPVLAAYTLKKGRPEDFKILSADCVPEYLALAGERLYFLHEGRIECFDLKTRARQTLLEGPCGSLQIFDGALFYTDAEGRCLRAALDGSGSEVLIDTPCDYAYAMAEGIVYQSESSENRLRMRLWDGADRQLSSAAAYAPLRLGELLWYTQKDELGSALACVDLTDGTVQRLDTPALRGAAELLPGKDGWLLRVFLAGDGWKQQLLRPGESEGQPCPYSGYRLCDYVGEALRIDAAYEADGRLRCFVLVGADGGELRFIGGQILN